MNWSRMAAFVLGVSVLAGIVAYAGIGSVMQALRVLRFSGLALITLLHLPVVLAMGIAWWLLGRNFPGSTTTKFAWARFVRDAAAEALPFSQIGGFVLGVRALHLDGVGALRGALSMSVDLVMELWAKIPYFIAGLVALFVAVPHSHPSRALVAALVLTIGVVAIPYVFGKRLRSALETSTMAIARRWPSLGSREDARLFFDGLFAERWVLPTSFAVHFACWVFGAFEMWVVLALMGHRVRPVEALAIDSLVSGLRTFAFLVPAAAGVQEACYVLVCAVFGIAPATAVAVSLARRARDLALGIPILAIWQYREATAGK